MSALVPQQQPSAIVKMGEVLARVSRAPSLPLAPAGYPRTMIIVRLLSGASEADALLAHLIALPSSVAPAVVHCGGPAGPSFKAHDEATVLRLETDDPDLVAKVIDFREINERRHVIALFDPECLRGALQVVDDLALLRYPIDIL